MRGLMRYDTDDVTYASHHVATLNRSSGLLGDSATVVALPKSSPLASFLTKERPEMQTWTDERIEQLKKLWADGLSASQIAGELGGITRNAVIGKVHRLGLSGRAKAPSSSILRQRKPRAPAMFRAPRPMMRGNTALAHMPAYDYTPDNLIETQVEPVENIIPFGQRCTLIELDPISKMEKCRWPIGDPGQPDFYFCGGKTNVKTPYCGYHGRVAYQPPMARRDRRPNRA
jgi:GcrA cell cycle regulator